MELLLKRKIFTDTSTIGELSCNGVFLCYILEDKDRGIRNTDSLASILNKKTFGKTAIPSGRYEITTTYSTRFKKDLPLLLNVPGFAGIRIHTGNTAADTEGCLLPGTAYSLDKVIQSKAAFAKLLDVMNTAPEGEKLFITIKASLN